MLAGGVDLAGAGGGELGADLGDEPVLDREVADEPGGAWQFSNADCAGDRRKQRAAVETHGAEPVPSTMRPFRMT